MEEGKVGRFIAIRNGKDLYLTDKGDVYHKVDPTNCTCPSFAKKGTCEHVQAAYPTKGVVALPSAVARPAAPRTRPVRSRKATAWRWFRIGLAVSLREIGKASTALSLLIDPRRN